MLMLQKLMYNSILKGSEIYVEKNGERYTGSICENEIGNFTHITNKGGKRFTSISDFGRHGLNELTPIEVVIFLILSPLGLFQFFKVRFTGSLRLTISLFI